MSNPFLKFYPADWRSDPRLRSCGPAARGLWVEILCLMHEAKPYGHLLINGEAPTDAQLAVQTGLLPDQLPTLLGELEKAQVFSRTARGVIFSRRMVRDEKRSRQAKKNGASGGNPTLGNKRTNSNPDNQKDKPPDKAKDKTQKPEARPPNGVIADGSGGKPSSEDGGSAPRAESHATPPTEPWKQGMLREIGDAAYRAWIADLRLEGETIYAVNQPRADQISERYGPQITRHTGIRGLRYRANQGEVR